MEALCFTVTLSHTQSPTERQKLVLEGELLCQRDGSVSKMDAAKAAALSSVPKTKGWEEGTAPGSCPLASTSTVQCVYPAPNTEFTNMRNTQGHLAKTHPKSSDTQTLKACGISTQGYRGCALCQEGYEHLLSSGSLRETGM